MELLLTTDPLLSSMEHVFNRSLDRAFKSLTPASDHSAVVLSCPFDITETPKAFQLVAGECRFRLFFVLVSTK